LSEGSKLSESHGHKTLRLALWVLSSIAKSAIPTLSTISAGASGSTNILRILVTNDDGVMAPGINAAVQALRALPHSSVVVVAPLTNESGTGGRTTSGKLVVSRSHTASVYPAIAVHGDPADTIRWAITDHGVTHRPDLVVSGINFGQNIGPSVDGSGTVGAARAAASVGVPAIAVSQGIDNGQGPNFAEGASLLVRWVQARGPALIDHTFSVHSSVSLNVPTCPGGVHGPILEPVATSANGVNILQVNCNSTATTFRDDVQAFVNGYAVISRLGRASK